MKKKIISLVLITALALSLAACSKDGAVNFVKDLFGAKEEETLDLSAVKPFTDSDVEADISPEGDRDYSFDRDGINLDIFSKDLSHVTANGNKPHFTEDDLTTETFINLSDFDRYNRCGVAFACLGPETLPESDRESIGNVKPSGWQTVRYDDLIEDKYLYNRCHLIAHCLSGLNAEEKNLITGTRFLNVEGMLPFEVQTVRYIEKTGNHVLYRVTPLFEDKNLVASGVLMEAMSVEDKGEGLSFCVFVGNIQPGIRIDYATGESEAL